MLSGYQIDETPSLYRTHLITASLSLLMLRLAFASKLIASALGFNLLEIFLQIKVLVIRIRNY